MSEVKKIVSSASPSRKRCAEEKEDAITCPGLLTKDDGDGWRWYDKSLLFFETTPRTVASPLIAAFDYDGCLANTSLFKKGPDAWSVLFPGQTEEALKALHGAGFKLVIMTNQSAIGKAKGSFDKTVAEKKGRLCGFVNKVGLPFQIFVATAGDTKNPDKYRKPETGMWDFLQKYANQGVPIDMTKSFFVGDAAGRKKDHGDSDLKLAKNAGVKFFTEDVFFKEGCYKELLK